MLADPLHPAVVHLPIALSILIACLAILGIPLIQKGFFKQKVRAVIVILQVLVAGSGWIALEAGEGQERRVERVVAERHIKGHEEAAERLFIFAELAAGISVGHSGGESVYKHGAASAFVEAQREFEARSGDSPE